MSTRIGIIGGSGFTRMPGLQIEHSGMVDTPFGPTSSEVVTGVLEDVEVAVISRHGPGHRLPPGSVPYRANIFALKTLGTHTVVSVSAVGSLHLPYAPGHLVLPDGLYDRTSGRPASFFGPGLVAHIGLAEPFCPGARRALLRSRAGIEAPVHEGGALIVVEGPRFSTRTESNLHRTWGCQLVGMTTMPEAALAREAEMCYVSVSVVTDYDVWHAREEGVSTQIVLDTMRESVHQAQLLVRTALPALAARESCGCRDALGTAMATADEAIDPDLAAMLAPIVGRYLDREA